MKVAPDDIEQLDQNISNFDGVIGEELEDTLRAGNAVAHTAWDHWGLIWFEDGQFHEMVLRYGAHVATVSDDTLADLILSVNDAWGHE